MDLTAIANIYDTTFTIILLASSTQWLIEIRFNVPLNANILSVIYEAFSPAIRPLDLRGNIRIIMLVWS